MYILCSYIFLYCVLKVELNTIFVEDRVSIFYKVTFLVGIFFWGNSDLKKKNAIKSLNILRKENSYGNLYTRRVVKNEGNICLNPRSKFLSVHCLQNILISVWANLSLNASRSSY